MNRLVLIGNGFDLAHDLKTSYKDFVMWYWNLWGLRLLNSLKRTESDGLCSFVMKENIDAPNWASVFQGWYYKKMNPLIKLTPEIAINRVIQDTKLCTLIISSPLLHKISSNFVYGWVDIENEYYSLLKLRNSPIKPSTKKNIRDLNNHLDTLRTYLIEYLLEEEKKKTNIIDDIKDKICRPIKIQEIAVANQNYSGSRLGDIDPSNIMLLNFNYTNTTEQYVTNKSNVKINHIHGRLDNPKSVIFGYGDEIDDDFKKLQNLNENECLRNIKSLHYLESDNYRKMLEFIESGPFQICIMGHSCGNSDRTLLNTLFEHRNCVSIIPYYYVKDDGTDNYLELIQNISRNFTDMKLMRDRVVNKTYCEPLVKKEEEDSEREMDRAE